LAPILSGPEEPGDLPIFRPRVGPRSPWSSTSSAGSFRNAVLRATRASVGQAGRAANPRSRVCSARPEAGSRRVIVKVHFVRMTASGSKASALHLRYIEREGVDKDGSKGVLYTADGLARGQAFEEPRRGERHQFRLMVSPEDAGELDLTDYVRRLMATVERDIGRKLEWAAVNHYNTEHPHAHLVIRGVGRDGREVRFDRGYISQGLRWCAQQLATEELGPRPERDVRTAQGKDVSQGRFTSLDRELERRARNHEVQPRSGARPGRIDESLLAARLAHLERLRLAERVGPGSWTLSPGWQAELRELGSRGDILKQIHKAVSGDPSRYRILRPGQSLHADERGRSGETTGRVASKGLSDQLEGTFYVVIETPSGDAYYLPVPARSTEELRVGDLVSFKTEPLDSVRHRLVFRKEPLSVEQQVPQPGPVWLDRLSADCCGRYGFGAEVRKAIGKRRDALRELGVLTERNKEIGR
jgi:type IV secretory pathway VirD2 relaxase